MTASEMARMRWKNVDAIERSRFMRALAIRRWKESGPHLTVWHGLRALETRIAGLEALLSESADRTTGFNARLLERK